MDRYKFRGKKVQMRGSMDKSKSSELVIGSYLWDGFEHFIITDENIEWSVDPKTVGQYTGRKVYEGDSEVDLFDGDIIKYVIQDHNGNDVGIFIGRVYYDEETSAFLVYCPKTDEVQWLYLILGNDDCVERIGNIHDNSNLLEG